MYIIIGFHYIAYNFMCFMHFTARAMLAQQCDGINYHYMSVCPSVCPSVRHKSALYKDG